MTHEQIIAQIRIKNIWKEINELVDQYALAMMDVTKKVIMEKIDFKLEEIDELKEVL